MANATPNGILKLARTLADVEAAKLDFEQGEGKAWVSSARDDLLSKRPELKLDSDGDAISTFSPASTPNTDLGVDERFTHVMALFVASAALRHKNTGVGKDRNAALDLLREYEAKVYAV